MSDQATFHTAELANEYVDFLTRVVLDEKGIRSHGWARLKADDKREVMFLALGPDEWAGAFWRFVGLAEPDKQRDELLMGLDMTTLPGQGTEFADAYVFVHWARVPGKKLACREAFRVGVINYQHEPRIVREVDWKNEYWTNWMLGHLSRYRPPFLLHFMGKEEAEAAGRVAHE